MLVLMRFGFHLGSGPESFGIIKKAENTCLAIPRFSICLSWGVALDWILLRAEANPDSLILEVHLVMASFSPGVSVSHVWK